MRSPKSVFVFTAVLLSIRLLAQAPAQSAFIRDSEIYATYSGAASPRQLTADGLAKSFVAASTDGTHIAFARDGLGVALTDLIIITSDGTELQQIHFRPVGGNVVGMRFVEGLAWVTAREVVLWGSLNPSTVEFAVVDIESGREVRGYLADGPAWAASPNGLHAAYVGYIPHFTPEERRRPQICIDEECAFDTHFGGYPPPTIHVEFLGKPVWSADSTRVAILAERYDTKRKLVIERPVKGRPRELAVPPEVGTKATVQWDASTIIIKEGERTWRIDSTEPHVQRGN